MLMDVAALSAHAPVLAKTQLLQLRQIGNRPKHQPQTANEALGNGMRMALASGAVIFLVRNVSRVRTPLSRRAASQDALPDMFSQPVYQRMAKFYTASKAELRMALAPLQNPGEAWPLTAKPFWETSVFPWMPKLMAALPEIKKELTSLRGKMTFSSQRMPTWAEGDEVATRLEAGFPGHVGGDWMTAYISLPGLQNINRLAEIRSLCPATVKLLDSIPRIFPHALFSALLPSTHIVPHCGQTNKKLRCLLPLVGPCCRLRVGSETRALTIGTPVMFDDSFEHEVWNEDPTLTRVAFIFDVWHPEFSDEEVDMLRQVDSQLEEEAWQSIIEKGDRQDSTYKILTRNKREDLPNDVDGLGAA